MSRPPRKSARDLMSEERAIEERAIDEHEITIQDLLHELFVLFICDSNHWNSNII